LLTSTFSSEVARQIDDTGCKLMLVDPALLDVAIEAIEVASFPRDRMLLFSDEPCRPTHGIQDWRSVCMETEAAQAWKWPAFNGDTCARTVAVLNYSSGYVTQGFPKRQER
jgi:4-coumarate--CoA ligase